MAECCNKKLTTIICYLSSAVRMFPARGYLCHDFHLIVFSCSSCLFRLWGSWMLSRFLWRSTGCYGYVLGVTTDYRYSSTFCVDLYVAKTPHQHVTYLLVFSGHLLTWISKGSQWKTDWQDAYSTVFYSGYMFVVFPAFFYFVKQLQFYKNRMSQHVFVLLICWCISCSRHKLRVL